MAQKLNTVDFAPIEAKVRESYTRQGLLQFLKGEMTRVEPGICHIQIPFTPETAQQDGFFHGGMVGTLADAAGGYAAMTTSPLDSTNLTAEYKINFLRPAKGTALRAKASVLKPGRTLTVVQADVEVLSEDGQWKQVAFMQQTIITVTREYVEK